MPDLPSESVPPAPPLWQRRALPSSFLAFLLGIPFLVAGQAMASDYTGTGNWKVERGQKFRFLLGVASSGDTHLASGTWLLVGRIALAAMVVAAAVCAILCPRIRAWNRSRR